jgi:hypothetical protein
VRLGSAKPAHQLIRNPNFRFFGSGVTADMDFAEYLIAIRAMAMEGRLIFMPVLFKGRTTRVESFERGNEELWNSAVFLLQFPGFLKAVFEIVETVVVIF